MKKIIINLIIILGILLILYPIIGRIITIINQTTVISNYKEQVNRMSDEDKEKQSNQYQEYNQKLSTTEELSGVDMLENGEIIGYISIPKIDVYLPIFEGTEESILLKGIGHLKQSSLPIGGKSTNSILVGHTGITAKTFFDGLTNLEIGDVFYIHILNEILEYKVSNTVVVLPHETDSIKIIEGEDKVTLVTCTPKYINSHRLLVIGERTEKINEKSTSINVYKEKSKLNYILFSIVSIIVFIVLILKLCKNLHR